MSDDQGGANGAAATLKFLDGGGGISALIRQTDWSEYPLGPPEGWPSVLKSSVAMMLPAAAQIVIFWGPDLIALYNDSYAPTIGDKHPRALGRPARENWAELWDDLEPLLTNVLHNGETVSATDRPFYIERGPAGETVYFDISYSPLRDEDGAVCGVLCLVKETTRKVLSEYQVRESEARFRFLDRITQATRAESDPQAIMAATTRLLGEHLDADICAYADVENDSDQFTIRRDWTRSGIPSIVGTYRLDTFGTVAAAAQRAGVPLVTRNAIAELGEEQAATFTAIGIAATICLPLVKDGRLAAMMAVHSAQPRDWTDADVALVGEVTERCWAHVERVGAESVLRQSEQRFRAAVDAVEGVLWTNNARGEMDGEQRGWAKLTGQTQEQYAGYGWAQAVHPDDAQPTINAWNQAVAGSSVFRFEHRVRTADRGWRLFTIRAIPTFDSQGSVLEWVGVHTDVTDQRAAEAALRAARDQASAEAAERAAILGQLNEGVIVADAEGRITFVNEAASRIHGVAKLDVAPDEYSETYHLFTEDGASYPPDRLPLARAVLAGESSTDERWRIRTPDGRSVLAVGSARPVFGTDGMRIGSVLTLRDDTARVAAEAALRESEARFRAMADSAPAPVWVTTRDGIAFANKAFGEVAGVLPEEITGEVWFGLIHPDDLPNVVERRDAAWRDGTDYGFTARFRAADASLRWMQVNCRRRFDAAGELSGYVGIAFDITDMRAASAALRESEERLRVALAAGALGDWAWDVETDVITFSEQAASLFGIPPGPVGTWAGLQKLIDPEDWAEATARVEAALLAGQDYNIEFRLKRPDGQAWINALGRPVMADGVARGVIGVVQDITARKRAEAALQDLNETLEQRVAEEIDRRAEAEEALRQAQKMETLGQLTGGVAHDFNNLLQIVSGNIGLIQRGLPQENARLRRAAENAARGAERAAVLTQRLLAFSRRQPLAPKPIDPNRMVGGMSDLLHRTLGEMIDVETVLAPRLWTIEADPNQLENAILNLAINARDAMPEGGKLTIETCNTHLDRAYTLQNVEVSVGQYVCICVTDSGSGMDQGTISRAFEPFFTTKEVGKGTGLGLSMVYGFVKQSGGHLKIYSERGEGTTVKIYLPRLIGDQPEAEEIVDELIPAGGQDETILVCEDDADVRAFTVEVLRELGYRVLEAEDGPSTLALLGRTEQVDLLFTDVVLPGGMTGAVLAREALARRPGLKVLYTTGYARNAIVHHGRLDAGVQLITKPFAYADLAAKVRDVLDGQS